MSSDLERLRNTNLRYTIVALLAFFLQGAFLANAIQNASNGSAWLWWAIILVFSATAITVAMIRAGRVAREYRRVAWGEEDASPARPRTAPSGPPPRE
jgi:hypothetical protein